MKCRINKAKSLLLLSTLFILSTGFSQIGLTFREAEKKGISIKHLDSIYKSAIHSDPTKAVYKTEAEQEKMIEDTTS